MAQVVRAALAEQDLAEIYDYVSDNDVEQAEKLLRLIDEKCKVLAAFPEMGLARHKLLVNMRSFPVKSYVVFY